MRLRESGFVRSGLRVPSESFCHSEQKNLASYVVFRLRSRETLQRTELSDASRMKDTEEWQSSVSSSRNQKQARFLSLFSHDPKSRCRFVSLLAEEEAEEEARRSMVEANLLAEQQLGVEVVSAVTESQKKSLEEELEHAGATAEEKQARW